MPADDARTGGTLALSAVVATTQAWPEAAACLDPLRMQIAAVGGEIVLGDGSADGVPAEIRGAHPDLRVLPMPGASVFRLRPAAVATARDAVVAITEDHCVVAPDWCSRILAAHRAASSSGPAGARRASADAAGARGASRMASAH